MNGLEVLGWVGSLLLAISLSMRNIWRLRLWNLAGATVFAMYGALIGAWPVVLLDGYIAAIDLVHIWRMKRKRDFFELLDIPYRYNAFVARFLVFHGDDIARYFPRFVLGEVTTPVITLTLRNMMPVGIFVHEVHGDEALVHLDYVVREYRDLANARHLFRRLGDDLAAAGVRRMVAPSFHPDHDRYLGRMGFRKLPGGEEGRSTWELPLPLSAPVR
ncbi:MAG: hypothetical protein AMXMBFR64_55550 [Myxococcales bacterium]